MLPFRPRLQSPSVPKVALSYTPGPSDLTQTIIISQRAALSWHKLADSLGKTTWQDKCPVDANLVPKAGPVHLPSKARA